MNEYKLQLKEELEALYNKLLMQHESLPSEVHKEWNTQAMEVVDAKLMELERELTIDIEAPVFEEVETDQTEKVTHKMIEKVQHYVPVLNPRIEYNQFAIELYAEDEFGLDVKIARFNVDGNNGYWVDLKGNYHHVKRWSTIERNLFKIDSNASLPSEYYITKLRKQFEEYQQGLAV